MIKLGSILPGLLHGQDHKAALKSKQFLHPEAKLVQASPPSQRGAGSTEQLPVSPSVFPSKSHFHFLPSPANSKSFRGKVGRDAGRRDLHFNWGHGRGAFWPPTHFSK